jgi:hypothetical protein
MKTLPADFPPPPADSAGLKAAFTWMIQVLTWLMARSAAGDRWWIGLEESQPDGPEPKTGTSDLTGPDGRTATEHSVGAGGASRTEARHGRPVLSPFEPQWAKGSELSALQIGPPPNPPVSLHSAPPATVGRRQWGRPTRQVPRCAPARLSSVWRPTDRLGDRLTRPTTGPPQISKRLTTTPTHVHFVTN